MAANILDIDRKSLALPVKNVNLILLVRIKHFRWKVERGLLHSPRPDVEHLLFLGIVHEMVVHHGLIMEQRYEDQLRIQKCRWDVRLIKTVYRHCLVVDFQHFIDFKLVSLNIRGCLMFLVENSEDESSIIDVSDWVFGPVGVLFNFFDFDVRVFLSTDDILGADGVMAASKVVLFNVIFSVCHLDDRDSSCGVIRDSNRYDFMLFLFFSLFFLNMLQMIFVFGSLYDLALG